MQKSYFPLNELITSGCYEDDPFHQVEEPAVSSPSCSSLREQRASRRGATQGEHPLDLLFFGGIFTNLLRYYLDMGDAALAKGMAGSRKCFDIFELPQRRGINLRISEESLMALFSCSFRLTARINWRRIHQNSSTAER